MAEVNTNFAELKDDEFVVFADKVITAISENSLFADIDPTPAELQVLADDYQEKQEVSSRGGSVLENMQKNDSRDALSKALKKWAHFVNEVADGNSTILTSSGMILAKPRTASEVPDIIGCVKLKDSSRSRQILASFEPQENIRGYEVQVGTIEDGQVNIQWGETQHSNSSRNFLIDELEPGVRYYVRVRARNSAGTGDWSEPVSLIAR